MKEPVTDLVVPLPVVRRIGIALLWHIAKDIKRRNQDGDCDEMDEATAEFLRAIEGPLSDPPPRCGWWHDLSTRPFYGQPTDPVQPDLEAVFSDFHRQFQGVADDAYQRLWAEEQDYDLKYRYTIYDRLPMHRYLVHRLGHPSDTVPALAIRWLMTTAMESMILILNALPLAEVEVDRFDTAIAVYLDRASNVFREHGCNDFWVDTTVPEFMDWRWRKAVYLEMQSLSPGLDAEELSEIIQGEDTSKEPYSQWCDFSLMVYVAQKLKPDTLPCFDKRRYEGRGFGQFRAVIKD